MTILTSVWRVQHPNAGRNIQHPLFLNFATNSVFTITKSLYNFNSTFYESLILILSFISKNFCLKISMKKLSTKEYLSGNNIYHLNLFSKLYHLNECLDRDSVYFTSPSETSYKLIYCHISTSCLIKI